LLIGSENYCYGKFPGYWMYIGYLFVTIQVKPNWLLYKMICL